MGTPGPPSYVPEINQRGEFLLLINLASELLLKLHLVCYLMLSVNN